jgi:hypothetical protein
LTPQLAVENLLSLKEAAEYLHVSPNIIRNYIAKRALSRNVSGQS